MNLQHELEQFSDEVLRKAAKIQDHEIEMMDVTYHHGFPMTGQWKIKNYLVRLDIRNSWYPIVRCTCKNGEANLGKTRCYHAARAIAEMEKL